MGNHSQRDVEQALSKVTHPEINYSLVDLGMIEDLVCEEQKVSLTLKLPLVPVPIQDLLLESIKKALSEQDSSVQVEINIEQMTQEQRSNFMQMAKKEWKL